MPQSDEPIPEIVRPRSGTGWCPAGTALRKAPDRNCNDGTIIRFIGQDEAHCDMHYWCAKPDGTRHGPSVVIRPGTAGPRRIGQFTHGCAHGRWRTYFEDRLWKETLYDRGKCVERVLYEIPELEPLFER